MRRAVRGALVGLAFVGVGCETISDPFDYAINLGTFSHDPALKNEARDVRRVVALRHGLFRSAASLWKLERALRDHGYAVFNASYGSTAGYIEDHAARLDRELEAYLDRTGREDPRPVELAFVGHSMGGLQIRQYLTRPGARKPVATVFLGTPHRGAVLVSKRKDWWFFPFLMGREGVLQLEPGHPFYATLGPMRGPFGIVYGGFANGEGRNDDIPGDDDGTVAVDEAQLPGATDTVCLPLGHTFLGIADASIHQVLYFLRHRRFDHRGHGPGARASGWSAQRGERSSIGQGHLRSALPVKRVLCAGCDHTPADRGEPR